MGAWSKLTGYWKRWTGQGRARVKIHTLPRSSPLSAREAFNKIDKVINTLDDQAHLQSIHAPAGVQADGRASAWRFGYDAPALQAYVTLHWELIPDDTRDAWFDSQLVEQIIPYAAPLRKRANTDTTVSDLYADHAIYAPKTFVDTPDLLEFLRKRGMPAQGKVDISSRLQEEQIRWRVVINGVEFDFPMDEALFRQVKA